MMEHKTRVEFDERFAALPYCMICACGHRTTCEDVAEAQHAEIAHREQVAERARRALLPRDDEP